MISRWTRCLVAAALAAAATQAAAQTTYPTKQVTIVVPLAPGTGMDSIVRLYAEPLDNPWASRSSWTTGGCIAHARRGRCRDRPSDGHTLLISTASPMAVIRCCSSR